MNRIEDWIQRNCWLGWRRRVGVSIWEGWVGASGNYPRLPLVEWHNESGYVRIPFTRWCLATYTRGAAADSVTGRADWDRDGAYNEMERK